MTNKKTAFRGPFCAIGTSGRECSSRTFINDVNLVISNVHLRWTGDISNASKLETEVKSAHFEGVGCGEKFDDIAWSMSTLLGTDTFCSLVRNFQPDVSCIPIDINWKIKTPHTPPTYYAIIPHRLLDCGTLVDRSVEHAGFEHKLTLRFVFDASRVTRGSNFFRMVCRESRFVISEVLRESIVEGKMRKCFFLRSERHESALVAVGGERTSHLT